MVCEARICSQCRLTRHLYTHSSSSVAAAGGSTLDGEPIVAFSRSGHGVPATDGPSVLTRVRDVGARSHLVLFAAVAQTKAITIPVRMNEATLDLFMGVQGVSVHSLALGGEVKRGQQQHLVEIYGLCVTGCNGGFLTI